MPDREPQRWPLVVSPSNRGESTNRDAKLLNGFVEQVDERTYWVYKRPGLATYSSATAATGRGVFNWAGNIYTIWGDRLFKDNVMVAGTVDTTGGVYTFGSTLGATPKLFFQNGVKAYTYDTAGGLVQVTDADYPATTCKGSAYLDGTTYVMKSASSDIRGSGINDATSWDPLNTILAQIEPDDGVFLAKQLVYVIAFQQWSVEVFYDAGNATGSPLGAVQGAKVSVGCRHQDSVQELEGALFWLAQARGGSMTVFMMEGLKAQQISTPPVDRLLEEADYTTVYSWVARVSGHKFYGLTVVNSNLTLVYDITQRRWYQWTDSNGNYVPLVSSTFTPAQRPILQHASNGKVYELDDASFLDDGAMITFDLYTPNYDGGTRISKYMQSMDIIADQTNGSKLQVRKSDDDYQSWSNFREVDLSKKRPRLTSMGSFRRRAMHFQHKCNTPLRLQAVEMQLDVGTL